MSPKRPVVVWIVFIAMLLALGTFLYLRIGTVISDSLSAKLGVKTKVDNINLLEKGLELEGFKIQNPRHSPVKNALTIENLGVKTPWMQVFANPIILDEISLENVYVSLVMSRDHKSACNWNILINNMSSGSPKWYSIKRTALIKHLVLKNVTIEIQLFGKKPQTLSPIDKLEFFNIDVKEGIPTNEISSIIVNKMIGSIFSLNTVKSILGLPFEAFKFIFTPGSSEGGDDPCPMYPNYGKKTKSTNKEEHQ